MPRFPDTGDPNRQTQESARWSMPGALLGTVFDHRLRIRIPHKPTHNADGEQSPKGFERNTPRHLSSLLFEDPERRPPIIQQLVSSPAVIDHRYSYCLPGHLPVRVFPPDFGGLLAGGTNHHSFLDHVYDIHGVDGTQEKDLIRFARRKNSREKRKTFPIEL